MAHFAQLDDNNVVTQVIVIDNAELLDNEVESEAKGISFCQSIFPETRWLQTSYNGNFRKNYAGVGFTYDAQRDAFIPQQPFPSWILDENICRWVAPLPYPDDGKRYYWDEESVSWVEAPESMADQ